MRIAYSVLAFCLVSCQHPDPRYVITEGRSSVKVPIETLDLSISVRSRNASLKEANQETRNSVLSMFRTFKKFGIADSDFVTERNSSSDRYDDYRGDKLAQVEYSGHLRLWDLKLFDPIFNELTTLGNVSISIEDFGSSRTDEYTRQSYEQALKSARNEAEMLVAGTGTKVGRILKILKTRGNPFDEYDDFEKHVANVTGPQTYASYDLESLNLEPTFRKRYFEISTFVTVMFEIE